jgi:hypothetical protein
MIVTTIASSLLGWIMISSGLDKAINQQSSYSLLASFLPRPFTPLVRRLVMRLLIINEVTIGAALLFGIALKLMMVLAISTLSIFLAVSLLAINQGGMACGCGGLLPIQRFGLLHVLLLTFLLVIAVIDATLIFMSNTELLAIHPPTVPVGLFASLTTLLLLVLVKACQEISNFARAIRLADQHFGKA